LFNRQAFETLSIEQTTCPPFRFYRICKVVICDLVVAELLQNLRRKGITLPLTDALIGAVAVRKQLPVLTADKHFDYLTVNSVSC
jgi:predicted nucleic acid-binding protein